MSSLRAGGGYSVSSVKFQVTNKGQKSEHRCSLSEFSEMEEKEESRKELNRTQCRRLIFNAEALTEGNERYTRSHSLPSERASVCENPKSKINNESGRQDSNLRSPAPRAGALTGLRYAPTHC